MAKASKGTVTDIQDETRKQRKKQAKQEAKLMLRLEQARKDVQKAEKKLTKAQANLEASNAHVRTLENKLTQLRSSEEDTRNGSGHTEAQSDEPGTLAETLTVFTADGAVPYIELPLLQTETSQIASDEQGDATDQEQKAQEPASNGFSSGAEDENISSSEQEAESNAPADEQ